MKTLLTLEERVRTTIATVEPAFNLLPGVVIIHNVYTRRVAYMSKMGEKQLGISSQELEQLDLEEYNNRFFNIEEAKEYAPKIFELIERNNDDEAISFFQQVRFADNDNWRWHLSTTKIFMRNEEGKPMLIITLSIAFDPNHSLTGKVQRLLDENNLLRNSQNIFTSLTKREKEILKLIAIGKNSTEVAATLYISEKTAETHRRNVRVKLNAHSNYDITRFAQAFNLI